MDLVTSGEELDLLLEGGGEADAADNGGSAATEDPGAPPDESVTDAGSYFDFSAMLDGAPIPVEGAGETAELPGGPAVCGIRIGFFPGDAIPPEFTDDFVPDDSWTDDTGDTGDGSFGDLIYVDWIPTDDDTGGDTGWVDDWDNAGDEVIFDGGDDGSATDDAGTGESGSGDAGGDDGSADAGDHTDGLEAIDDFAICVLYAPVDMIL